LVFQTSIMELRQLQIFINTTVNNFSLNQL